MTSYELSFVQPKEWQKKILGKLNHGDKGQAMDFCKKKGIDLISFINKKDKNLLSGLADSICIAEYGRLEQHKLEF